MALSNNHTVMQDILNQLTHVVGQSAKFWRDGKYHDGFVTRILCGGDEIPGTESDWLYWDVEVTTPAGLKGRTGISDLVEKDQLEKIWDDQLFTLVDPRLSPYRPRVVDRQRVEQGLGPVTSIRRDEYGLLYLWVEWGKAQEAARSIKGITRAPMHDPDFWRIFDLLKALNPTVYMGGPAIPTPPYERSFWLDNLGAVLEEIESQRYQGVLCRDAGEATSRSPLARNGTVCTHTEFVFE